MTNVELVPYQKEYYNALLVFKSKKYKRDDTKQYFDFRFVEHPYLDEKTSPAILVLEGCNRGAN